QHLDILIIWNLGPAHILTLH
ncbi:NAD dependent epimerase/dehydratase family protein, partial [Vibrio parahaemolyticus V-223/04]